MKTQEKRVTRAIILTTLLSSATALNAATPGKFVDGVMQEMSKDGFIGFYVFFGVIAFATIAYVTSLMVEKYTNKEDKEHNNIRHISRRNHPHHQHHHKVIKKSA